MKAFNIGDLSAKEIAYLASGASEKRVTNIVIISLIERGFLLWNFAEQNFTVLAANDWRLTDNEKLLLHNINDKEQIQSIYDIEVKNIENKFKNRGIDINFRTITSILMWVIFVMFIIQTPFVVLFVLLNIFCDTHWDFLNRYCTTLMQMIPLLFVSGLCDAYQNHSLKKRLLKQYLQAIPASANNLYESLSTCYALYGDEILTSEQFAGLNEFLNPPPPPTVHNADYHDVGYDDGGD